MKKPNENSQPKKDQEAKSFSKKEALLLCFSIITFCITIFNTWNSWKRDAVHTMEHEPDLRVTLKVPAEGSPYGFFLENRGERPVKIMSMSTGLKSGVDRVYVEKLLSDTGIEDVNFANVRLLGALISENSSTPIYIFNKQMNNFEYLKWVEYAHSLTADFCFCTIDSEACWNNHFEFKKPTEKVRNFARCDEQPTRGTAS